MNLNATIDLDRNQTVALLAKALAKRQIEIIDTPVFIQRGQRKQHIKMEVTTKDNQRGLVEKLTIDSDQIKTLLRESLNECPYDVVRPFVQLTLESPALRAQASEVFAKVFIRLALSA